MTVQSHTRAHTGMTLASRSRRGRFSAVHAGARICAGVWEYGTYRGRNVLDVAKNEEGEESKEREKRG